MLNDPRAQRARLGYSSMDWGILLGYSHRL